MTSVEGEVKLNPNGQTSRIIMARSIDINVFETCIKAVKEYVAAQITGLCQNIEAALSKGQKEVINTSSKAKLFEDNWRARQRISPFERRKS